MATIKTLTLCLIASGSLWAQSTVAEFMNVPHGARTIASGGTFLLGQGDNAAFIHMPADYTLNTKPKIILTAENRFGGLVNQYHLGFSQPILGGYNVTVNYRYNGVTDIPRFDQLVLNDADGLPTQQSPSGFFGNYNHMGSVFFGKVYDYVVDVGWDYFTFPIRFPVGLNANVLVSQIDSYSAFGSSVDLSAGMMFNLGQVLQQEESIGDLQMYMTFSNMIESSLSWDEVRSPYDAETSATSDETIPTVTRFGMNILSDLDELDSELAFMTSYESAFELFRFGMMYRYDKLVEFRLGVQDGIVSLGAGVTIDQYDVFLSYSPSEDLGQTITIDLSYDL